MTKLRENQLANHICHWLLKWGAFVWVNDSVGIYDKASHSFRSNKNPYRLKGVADIIGICGSGELWPFQPKPTPLAVEVKMEKGRQSDEQKSFEERFVKAGGVYVLARSLLDVKTALGLPDTIEMPITQVLGSNIDGQRQEDGR